MRLLLDTQCWLWMLVSPKRSGEETRAVLADPSNELLLSVASAWEIAIKHGLGKLPLPAPPTEYVLSRMASSGTSGLPVEHVHALQVSELPLHHRDPFDRLLIAQAQVEEIPILSADDAFGRYDVDVWRP